MAKINDIKLSKVREDGKAELIVRLYVTKTFCPQFKTGLFIDPAYFIDKTEKNLKTNGKKSRCTEYEIIIPKKGKHNFNEVKENTEVKTKLDLYITQLLRICDQTAEKHLNQLDREWVEASIRLINKANINIADITYLNFSI